MKVRCLLRLSCAGWLALGLSLSLASPVFAPPALAQQSKAAAQAIRAAEAKYDNARQAELMQQQVAALKPQTPGVTDIYAIGVSGWGTQDVFLKELNGGLAATEKVLPLSGTIRLVNDPSTFETLPLASRKNFASALRAVAAVMDKDEDVLFLFITSHGIPQGVGLELPSVLVFLTPQDVAAALKRAGIRNRVVIVSACFAGIFIKPLANTNTIVLTAADRKHTSFGCADGRDWTYFGDALFAHSLTPGNDFRSAFRHARALIAGWEKTEKYEPSNPQGSFGKALEAKLAPLFAATAARAQTP